jgi:hypothetical protein
MAAIGTTTANLPNILVRTYNREGYIAPHERHMAKFYDTTEDFEDGGKPVGSARYFGIRTKDSHATGGTAEAGDLPTFSAPSVLQASVTGVQVSASVAWSELMMLVGQAEGSIYAEDIIDDHVKMTVRNMMTRLNSLTLGHGTGRLAAVQTTTTSATTFIARLPEHVLQLREGMLVDFYDTDTSGSKQGASQTIVSINFETRTVTINNGRSLTADWGIYKALSSTVSSYGVAPNGLRGIVDDGDLAATIFGITRSSNPQVNATELNASGGLQDYTEKLVRKGINRIFFQTGLEPDEIWMNQGILSEHLNHLVGDRIYQLGPNDNVPKYRIGQNLMDIGFQHNGRFIPFKIESDLPARELFIITKNLFRRHVLRKANWIGDNIGPDGSPTAVLMQAPASAGQTYSLQKIAGMLWVGNMAHLQPKANTVINEISDEELAGDAAA